MIFQFYFKKMPSSEFLKNLSQRKLTDVIERFVGSTGLVHLTFHDERKEHHVHCRLHSWTGTVLHVSSADENMFAAIDKVAQKLEAQLSRHKVRTQRKVRPASLKTVSGLWEPDLEFPVGWQADPEPSAGEGFRLLN